MEDFKTKLQSLNTQDNETILLVIESKYLEDSELKDINYDLLAQKQAFKLIRIKPEAIIK
jgi:hypothetical protein